MSDGANVDFLPSSGVAGRGQAEPIIGLQATPRSCFLQGQLRAMALAWGACAKAEEAGKVGVVGDACMV